MATFLIAGAAVVVAVLVIAAFAWLSRAVQTYRQASHGHDRQDRDAAGLALRSRLRRAGRLSLRTMISQTPPDAGRPADDLERDDVTPSATRCPRCGRATVEDVTPLLQRCRSCSHHWVKPA